jgi:predicted Rossmann fold nucleotide-binding protein DprA/Smf involved in DNA uptake
VNETGVLVAMPDGPEELRSGTWATVRYARKQGKDGRIIYPDGLVTPL